VPTFERVERFIRDYHNLSAAEKEAFRGAIKQFVEDMEAGRAFRKGLGVKGVKGAPGIFEMTWADDGRATFSYGDPVHEGEPHIVWRRVGTHDIF
jgi:hypothetical protein